ncbi:MAG TPA: alanine dehydrogenase [Dermatophilaceae bacterium]|nr:alanine dehydrogenase [Dermatophilaceae bacterium]
MRIGVPTEVKNNEYRVAMTPVGVHELVAHGHEVLVQAGAGAGCGISDDEYAAQGATVLESADEVWGDSQMVLKVKEPVAQEYHRLRDDLVLFTYLHLAASLECTEALLKAGTTGIAYETVQLADGHLPLLYPMSEVAGCLAPQVGAHTLMKAQGGRGVLMGCIGGVEAAKVVVLGGGVSGQNAANVAMGMGADVTILDTNIEKLRSIFWRFGGRIQGIASSLLAVRELVGQADLVIGAVLVPGAKAPTLVTNDMVAGMKPGSVLVDIAVDQGGCFEDTRPTTHAEPTYRVHGSLFYCVSNMPGAVPHTSTYALTNVTTPYALRLADAGWRAACMADPALAAGVNTHAGQVTYPAVAEAHGLPSASIADGLDSRPWVATG